MTGQTGKRSKVLAAAAAAAVAEPGSGSSGRVRLTSAQGARALGTFQSWPEPANVIPLSYEVDFVLDTGIGAAAVASVVARHRQLRMRSDPPASPGAPPEFAREEPLESSVSWAHHDLRGLPRDALRAIAAALAERDSSRPLLPDRDPALRMTALIISDRRSVLLISLSHVFGDGYSARIVMRDFMRAYETLARGGRNGLEQPEDFTNFQGLELERERSGESVRHVRWWADRLGSVSGTTVEARSDQPAALIHKRLLPGGLLPTAVAFARERRTSLLCVAIAAVSVAFARMMAVDSFVFDVPYVGDRFPRFRETVGLFATRIFVTLRVQFGRDTFADLVDRVSAELLEGLEHTGAPTPQVRGELARKGKAMPEVLGVQTVTPELGPAAAARAWRLSELRTGATSLPCWVMLEEHARRARKLWVCHQLAWLPAAAGSALADAVAETFERVIDAPESVLQGVGDPPEDMDPARANRAIAVAR